MGENADIAGTQSTGFWDGESSCDEVFCWLLYSHTRRSGKWMVEGIHSKCSFRPASSFTPMALESRENTLAVKPLEVLDEAFLPGAN
jgi:hypothetical protein